MLFLEVVHFLDFTLSPRSTFSASFTQVALCNKHNRKIVGKTVSSKCIFAVG